jgi:hypothetical protein
MLVGSRLFNKRHHGATRLAINPVKNNFLTVYGGPNGLVVYELLNLKHFFEEEFFSHHAMVTNR